ncbi:HNH endonuclease [Parabacteroides sp. AF17-3]|uniref:HNH endonuclease n=1 Tax=Parabacteroides sp. AF17-3 TaxID=2293113 RepID=UPI000EFDE6FF|nr:HNH endonuclease [Parabacteroides sp. AF17-3]RKU71717.1 HNH endonuclease [Parabacteroides sp. AF17-3]
MIKLTLPERPIELTDEEECALVDEYKRNKTPVWKKKYIVDKILEMSNYKCAFSEQKLNTESAYAEVEHFKCKEKYIEEVVHWGNLLPICKKCNTSKGDWDVEQDHIVNPLVDDPKDYLYVKAFRFYKKNSIGENTIDAVSLNSREHFVSPRSKIGFEIADSLDDNWDRLQKADTKRQKVNVINRIKGILRNCGPENIYSAVLSTYVLYEIETYNEIEEFLKKNDLWDEELEDIKKNLLFCSLPAPSVK